MLTQPDGIISYLSPACEKVLGYNAEELIGQQPWIIYPDDLEKAKEVHYRALKGERGTDFEYRIKTKTGKIKWISHSWSPVFKDDKVQMMTSVVRDITERKKADEKLKEKIDELERYKNVTVGRELRMVELKKRIKKLEEK
jgi:two-component system sporulation sensor kinase A